MMGLGKMTPEGERSTFTRTIRGLEAGEFDKIVLLTLLEDDQLSGSLKTAAMI
jgi:hypothetical protein